MRSIAIRSGPENFWSYLRRTAIRFFSGAQVADVAFFVGQVVTIQVVPTKSLVRGAITNVSKLAHRTAISVLAERAILPDTNIDIPLDANRHLHAKVRYCIGEGSGYRVTALLSILGRS
jgi:hypothetical protein